MTNNQHINAYKKTQQSSNAVKSSHQIVKALELYVNDTNTGKGGEPDELILPSKTTQIGKEINSIYHKIKSSYNERYLKQVFYCRKKYDDILPELKS